MEAKTPGPSDGVLRSTGKKAGFWESNQIRQGAGSPAKDPGRLVGAGLVAATLDPVRKRHVRNRAISVFAANRDDSPGIAKIGEIPEG